MTVVVRRRILQFLSLIALTVSAYSFMVHDSFKTMDDEYCIIDNREIKDLKNAGRLFTHSFFGTGAYYRPLVSLSFMLEYRFFGLNPFYYYLDNILLHLATALVVWSFLIRLLRQETLAFATALLFAIHPVHWEAVSNIPGRAILLSSFFSMVAIWAFCRREKSRWLVPVSLGALALGLLSKESAGVIPLVLVAYQGTVAKRPSAAFSPRSLVRLPTRKPPRSLVDALHLGVLQQSHQWFWGQKGKGVAGPLWGRGIFPVLPFFVLTASYLLIRRNLGLNKFFLWNDPGQGVLGFLSFLRSLMTHLRVLVFPYGLHFDRSCPVFLNFLDGGIWLVALFWTSFIVGVWHWRKKISPLCWFLGSWFFIEFLPVSQLGVSIGVQPGYISAADHFLYMPAVGFLTLAVLAGQRLYEKNLQARWVSVFVFKFLLIAVYAGFWLTCVEQNIYSSNEIAMFERTVAINPTNARVHYNLGYVYAQKRLFVEAVREFRRVLELTPGVVNARISLGKALCDQGKLWEGLQEYERVGDAGDLKDLLAGNRHAAYQLLENGYRERLSRRPDDALAYYSLGVVYSKTERLLPAIANFEQAVVLSPDFREAVFNLASSYEVAGQTEKAAVLFERVLRLPEKNDGLSGIAQEHLAQIYQKLSPPQKAVDIMKK